ncbi:UvrD-helicase domain-containing protein [Streptomyces sp. SP2-10]|uniref:UvrD-helicase domain-containing protein n=1 Tax=Streptomyces sp. SP2-10 TaxID=2873385 RepID=UPI001CA69245|nr:ATP-dependent helicase [Streptomyces sp. SP2-10]MBY8844587.1 ATP-dependent helicase [Streptomyces sp. SP2-10]
MLLDDKRLEIIRTPGHLLIEGGPGSGKTTIALLATREFLGMLEPGQRVLFLSFSRAAVRQISDRMSGILPQRAQDLLEVRTFHAFFMDLVRSHGRLLTGVPASFITPDREKRLRADFDGDWLEERRRLAGQGRYVFDELAPAAATLLEQSAAVRDLYADMYPTVIVDEFQDTSSDQWRAVKMFSANSRVICLADPDQRIYDYVPGVDARRIHYAVEHLQPRRFDLSGDNHRSPSGGLLDYANAVLRYIPHPLPDAVKRIRYPTTYGSPPVETYAHYAVTALRRYLAKELGRQPTIAVLARENAFLGRISDKIAAEGKLGQHALPAVEHDLVFDAELSAAAGYVVASVLEWPGLPRREALTRTLQAVGDYYRVKYSNGTRGARETVRTLDNAITAVRDGKTVKAKTAKLLAGVYDAGIQLTGQPVSDWQKARALLTGSAELNELFKQARMLRLLKATDLLAWTLAEAWDTTSYADAAAAIRRALGQEYLTGSQQEAEDVSLMSIHRSKGKEFDGVVIVEGTYSSRLLDTGWDAKRTDEARRLLRVAITRARHTVVLVRPADAIALTPPARDGS